MSRRVPCYISCAGFSAEPRIVLENSNPFVIDAVTFAGGTAGDCIIKFPQVGKTITVRY